MKISNNKPIGIFDSGVGGLTVYKELKQMMPEESFVYLGDTARVPYGTKSREIVIKYALQDSLFLMDQGVKMVVVACNTASAFALQYLQDRMRVPTVGVIEPGARAAMAVTKNHCVGIVGTEGTIRSKVYEQALKAIHPEVVCHSKATSLFVPLIEEHISDPKILYPVFDMYLKDLKAKDIDALILGCTHYPLLKPVLNEYFSDSISLIDSAYVTAKVVHELLVENQLVHKGKKDSEDRIFVTDAPERVERIAEYFLGFTGAEIVKTEVN